MSIGLGIFLGLVFCGLVFLYSRNKLDFNFRKTMKWVFIIVLVPVVPIVIYLVWEFAHYQYLNRNIVMKEFMNISIDDTLTNTKFRVGELTLDKNVTEFREYDKKYPTDGYYYLPDKRTSVSIRQGKVETIEYDCPNSGTDLVFVNTIQCGNTGEQVLEKFGTKLVIKCLTDDTVTFDKDLVRAYDVAKYNTRYLLYQNHVIGFVISGNDLFTSDRYWKKCK